MSNWTLRPELDQTLPRSVRMSPGGKTVLGFFTLFYMVMLAIAGAATGPSIYKTSVLKTRGLAAEATVTDLRTVQGRHGPTYSVDYSYELPHENARYSATDSTDLSHFSQLHAGDAVPIAYDRVSPGTSALNFGNQVFATSDLAIFFPLILSIAIVSLGSMIAPLLILRSYYRDKRLLQTGLAAAATILEDHEHMGHGAKVANLAYSFTDNLGSTVKGWRGGLPAKDKRTTAWSRAIFENPTVIYDPQNSRRNMLYPSAWAVCVPRSPASPFSAP